MKVGTLHIFVDLHLLDMERAFYVNKEADAAVFISRQTFEDQERPLRVLIVVDPEGEV